MQVQNITGMVQASGGSEHSLAVKQDGTVWAWGQNNDGQLGDGTNTSRSSPVELSGISGVLRVSCGGNFASSHSLAVKTDGSVWAWGENFYGQLGDGTSTDRNSPVKVGLVTGLESVSAGGTHSAGVRTDGVAWAWGNNLNWQLGSYGGICPVWLEWQYSLAGHVTYSSFAVGDDSTIYRGLWGPLMVALNNDGTLKWQYAPSEPASGLETPPAVDSMGNVYYVKNVTGLVAVSSSGSLLWTRSGPGDYGWPCVAIGFDGTLFVAGDTGAGSAMIAVNPSDGSLVWSRSDIGGPGWFPGVAISEDGATVYAARKGGKVFALCACTGETIWESAVGGSGEQFGGNPALSGNGILYVMGDDGASNTQVYAVDATNGALLWKYQLNSYHVYWGPQSPAIGPDGTLYVVSSGNAGLGGGTTPARLYAFK